MYLTQSEIQQLDLLKKKTPSERFSLMVQLIGDQIEAMKAGIRVWEKITLLFMALSFRSDLVELIELNRKHSLSYVEDSANEDRTKMAWK